MPVHLFVPRWMDPSITNAQNSNARALLSRFTDPRALWTAVGHEELPEGASGDGFSTVRLARNRLWKYQLALAYQSNFDAIFYPGVDWADEVGMKLRRLSGRRTLVISTLEGIVADDPTTRQLSDMVAHAVFAQPGIEGVVPRIRALYEHADHIIAISPFLARVAEFLYGKKVFCLPLGVEGKIFHSRGRTEPTRCRAVSCGTVKRSKNPQMFLHLANRYKHADFVWFGDGPMVPSLNAEASKMGLTNLRFAGGTEPASLAEEFRKSSFLVLPSYSEGVPKVTQEAAACGLPIVLNGFYEAPTVIHQRNGLVAWSDEELSGHVRTLIDDPNLRGKMGEQSVAMAADWDWDRIAPRWEELLIRLATSKS